MLRSFSLEPSGGPTPRRTNDDKSSLFHHYYESGYTSTASGVACLAFKDMTERRETRCYLPGETMDECFNIDSGGDVFVPLSPRVKAEPRPCVCSAAVPLISAVFL